MVCTLHVLIRNMYVCLEHALYVRFSTIHAVVVILMTGWSMKVITEDELPDVS